MSTYMKINVSKPQGISPGAAAPKDPNVTVVDVEDIQFFPARDGKGVKYTGNFVMKPGAKMIQFYSTASKVSAPYESDGEEDAVAIAQSFEAQHPGNSLEIKEFIQNWLGKNVIIFHGSCVDNFREVLGTKCAPLQLKPAKQDNNEGRFHTLVFEQFNPSAMVPGHYEGALSFEEPHEVSSVADVDVTEANGHQYQLPPLAETDTIEFGDLTVPDESIITLIGGGGAAPATLASAASGSATVILKNGTTWVALQGAVIHLKYFNAGATKYLIELSRG
jgi:hypothetical protein